jgi:hypothetical protein
VKTKKVPCMSAHSRNADCSPPQARRRYYLSASLIFPSSKKTSGLLGFLGYCPIEGFDFNEGTTA